MCRNHERLHEADKLWNVKHLPAFVRKALLTGDMTVNMHTVHKLSNRLHGQMTLDHTE